MSHNRKDGKYMTLEKDFKQTFQKELKKKVKPVAILQYKQDATTLKGFPDTIVILEGVVVFIEYKKSKTAKFQEGQKLWIERLTDANHFAFVCHPGNWKEVLSEIERLK